MHTKVENYMKTVKSINSQFIDTNSAWTRWDKVKAYSRCSPKKGIKQLDGE